MKTCVIIIEVFLKLKKNSCQAAADLGFSKKIYIFILTFLGLQS